MFLTVSRLQCLNLVAIILVVLMTFHYDRVYSTVHVLQYSTSTESSSGRGSLYVEYAIDLPYSCGVSLVLDRKFGS